MMKYNRYLFLTIVAFLSLILFSEDVFAGSYSCQVGGSVSISCPDSRDYISVYGSNASSYGVNQVKCNSAGTVNGDCHHLEEKGFLFTRRSELVYTEKFTITISENKTDDDDKKKSVCDSGQGAYTIPEGGSVSIKLNDGDTCNVVQGSGYIKASATGIKNINSCIITGIKATGGASVAINSKDKTCSKNITVTKKKTEKKNKRNSGVTSEGICSLFNICNASTGNPDKTLLEGINSYLYKITADESCGMSDVDFVTFCIDPGKPGAPACTKGGIGYQYSEVIDIAKPAGKRLYGLYLAYLDNGGCSSSDISCVVGYQTAARLIIYHTPNQEIGIKYNTGGSLEASHRAFLSDSVSGPAATAARGYIAQADAKIAALGDALADSAKTVNASLTQASSVTKTSSGYSVDYDFFLENGAIAPSFETSYEWKDGKNGGTVTELSHETIGPDVVYHLRINGPINAGDCSAYTLIAKASYMNPKDPRNSFTVEAVGDNSTYYQRYLVFGGKFALTTQAIANINPGNTACGGGGGHTCSGCFTSGALACNKNEGGTSYITINEGTHGDGETDWENCIIGCTDEAGNPYDIENQTAQSVADEDNYDEDSRYQEEGEQDDLKGKIIICGSTGSIGKGYETLTDASFCTISCKEKYDLILPSNKENVLVGTWFDHNVTGAAPDNNDPSLYHSVVGIKAERKCVTSNDADKSGNVDTEIFEERVNNLRKQQVDYMNAYEYYKAMYAELVKDESKDKYLSIALKEAEVKTGNNYSNRVNGATKEGVEASYQIVYGTGVDSSAYMVDIDAMDIDFTFNQYKLTNPDAADSEIEKVEDVEGNTQYAFTNKESGTLKNFFITDEKNCYSAVYPDYAELFNTTSAVSGESYSGSQSYYYEYTKNICEDGIEREIDGETICDGGNWKSQKYSGNESITVKYYTKGRDAKLTMYNKMLEALDGVVESALAKVEALSRQISMQASSIVTCTKYLESLEQGNKGYTFDPKISFEYDQDEYMSMLNPELALASSEPDLNITLSYCESGSGNAASVFNCGGESNSVDYNYFDGEGNATSVSYNNVLRAASTSTYTCDGGYCFYRSATQFFTHQPDGIVTNVPYDRNDTLIQYDGRVYPITIKTPTGLHEFKIKFANIGQYFQTGYLGRIMGGSASVNATMQGDSKDSAVCYYDVINPFVDDDDDDDDDDDKPSTCNKVVATKCNDGAFSTLTADGLTTCVNELLKVKEQGVSVCCLEAKQAIKSSGLASPTTIADFNVACPNDCKACIGYKLVTNDSASTSTSSYDQALVDTAGNLNFTVRTVSLNRLFPNGNSTRGRNWKMDTTDLITGDSRAQTHGLTINEIVTRIQDNGESIYGSEPDYSFTLTPACIKAIQNYNRSQDSTENGLNDYDLTVNTNWNDTIYASSRASWEDGDFYNFLTANKDICSFTAKNSDNLGIKKDADNPYNIPSIVVEYYSVVYDANGGAGAPYGHNKIAWGKKITIASAKPVRDGYTFKGWARSDTALEAEFATGYAYDLYNYTTKNGTLKLYAVWQKNDDKEDVDPESDTFKVQILVEHGTTLTESAEIKLDGQINTSVTPNDGYAILRASCSNGYTISGFSGGYDATSTQNITINNNNMKNNTICTFYARKKSCTYERSNFSRSHWKGSYACVNGKAKMNACYFVPDDTHSVLCDISNYGCTSDKWVNGNYEYVSPYSKCNKSITVDYLRNEVGCYYEYNSNRTSKIMHCGNSKKFDSITVGGWHNADSEPFINIGSISVQVAGLAEEADYCECED